MATTNTTEKITPSVAEEWLNHNRSNRKLRDGVVEKYADDMLNGRWTECTAPIVFYDDGDIADGQHRLWAIVESKRSQTFDVKRGLDRIAGINIDIGLGRSLVDNAKISGADRSLTSELVAVARGIEDGSHSNNAAAGGRARSNTAKMEVVAKHRDAAQWACSNGPRGKGIRNAIILSAVGRAHLAGVDLDRLKRFCAVMTTGLYDGDGETAGVAMRNYMITKGSTTSSSPLWRDTFIKTQNAIRYFIAGKKLTAIKAVKEEACPLPARRAGSRK